LISKKLKDNTLTKTTPIAKNHFITT